VPPGRRGSSGPPRPAAPQPTTPHLSTASWQQVSAAGPTLRCLLGAGQPGWLAGWLGGGSCLHLVGMTWPGLPCTCLPASRTVLPLPACLSRLPVSLACLSRPPACLSRPPACLSRPPACLPACLPACPLACLPTSSHLPSRLPPPAEAATELKEIQELLQQRYREQSAAESSG